MKKCLFIFIFLSIPFVLLGAENEWEFRTVGNKVLVEFERTEPGIPEDTTLYKTIAFPYPDAKIVINRCEVSIYGEDGDLIKNQIVPVNNRIEIIDSFVMRELVGHHIRINLIREEKGYKSIIKECNFELVPMPESQEAVCVGVSTPFLYVFRSIVDNFDDSYLRNLQMLPSHMLIITPQYLVDFLSPFIDWKEAKGIMCSVATLTETGETSSEIKSYIQNAYETWENPPDYLLLIGDVEQLPSFYYENNVTDHPYTLLEGDDYFPEMLVGRLSIDSVTELLTVINKILKYERQPYMENPEWLKRALIVAGNYSESIPIPTTPVKVSRWLYDKMLDYGYTQVDTIFYPPTYPGTSEIAGAINNGVGFVSYRGWGDANGWHYPHFHIGNIGELSNGLFLPVMTSFVCNTGDFANNVDPCFGEAWLQYGTPTLPKGGVAFLGPSDLYTSTKYNNSIFSGFYYGVLDENIHILGAATLRGKIEMYHNFPLNHELGDDVDFYFHVYNILGDPSLSMWTTIPQEITYDIPEKISLGTNNLTIDLPGLDGGITTARKENEFYDVRVIENGSVTLYLEPETTGTIEVTITKPNYLPRIDSINVVIEPIDIGMYEFELDKLPNPGEVINTAITLKNYGSQDASSVSAELTTNNPFVNLIDSIANYGNIDSGETATQTYQFEILPQCPDSQIMEFTLMISAGNIAKFEIMVSGLVFELQNVAVEDDNGILDPGEERDILISVKNTGSLEGYELTGELNTTSDAIEIISPNGSFETIEPGDTGSTSFTVYAKPDCYIGRNIPFDLELTSEDGLLAFIQFSLEIGEVDNTAPTGPDNFGYFAYDSYDQNYNECPEYFWYEIDPEQGGSGSVSLLGDDRSVTVPLPFDFIYYGEVFDSVTICSNGWISLEPTWMTNFRNWNIPAALGPYAMIAPFWDDLIGANEEKMRVCYQYDTSEDIFIIEWNNCVNNYDKESIEKFQIILFNPQSYPTIDGNGEIQFNYHTVSNPDAVSNYATVGIENLDQSDGVLYTYANIYPQSTTPLQNNFSIKFTTNPPDNYYGIDIPSLNSTAKIYQNTPNPFSTSTKISFNISTNYTNLDEEARIKIYNIKGQLVKQFNPPAGGSDLGFGEAIWDGRDSSGKPVPSGVYLYRLTTDSFTSDTKKMILIR